jgi:hypothetical protein
VLFSAVQPQPSDRDGDQYRFVRVEFETPADTTDWEIQSENDVDTELPDRELSGEIYFATNENAFEDERGLNDSVVYPLTTDLAEADALTLVSDASGEARFRDEVAFEADTDETPSTTNGWTVSDLGSGEVAVRKNIGVPYRDADNVSDWRVTSQQSFFGAPDSVSVAFVPNSNQKLIRTVTSGTDGTDGTVIDYGEDSSQINILGPKTDLDDDGQDEVLYQVQSNTNGNAIRYMDPDGTVTSVVDRDVRQASAFGVGDPDNVTTVLYATTDGRLTEVEIGGGPPQTVTYTAGNSQANAGNIKDVRAKGAVGYGDVNGDEDLDPIFVPKDTSKKIGYIDNNSRPTTEKIGPRGNRYQIGDGHAVGEPVAIDGNLRVPIVNGSQDLLLVNPENGSIETVNRGTVKPKKSPITVRDWRGDSKKEILVINGNDNQHLYYVEANTGGSNETGEVRDEEAKDKGVQ